MNTISPISLSYGYKNYNKQMSFNGVKEKAMTKVAEGVKKGFDTMPAANGVVIPKAGAKTLREVKIQEIKDLEKKLGEYPEFIKKGPLNIANPDYYGIKTAIRKLENEILNLK